MIFVNKMGQNKGFPAVAAEAAVPMVSLKYFSSKTKQLTLESWHFEDTLTRSLTTGNVTKFIISSLTDIMTASFLIIVALIMHKNQATPRIRDAAPACSETFSPPFLMNYLLKRLITKQLDCCVELEFGRRYNPMHGRPSTRTHCLDK